MKKKDIERLAEIALRANAGDGAQASAMAKRLWRVRRWAAEQTWRAEASKADGRRGILEQLCASVDGALHALERLRTHRDAPAPEIAAAPVAPAVAVPAIAKPADDDEKLAPKSTEEKVALVVDALKGRVTA